MVKKTLFLTGLWMALLATTAQAGVKCEVYIAHTCTTVTITAEGFPGGEAKIQTTIRINGIDTVDVRTFEGTDDAFTLDIANANDAVDVHVQAHARDGERIRYAFAALSFTRAGCVQAPKPPKTPPSVHVSKFFGDPLINITLTGPGHFTVRGGDRMLNLKGAHVVTRYHVLPGHTLRIFVDGRLALSRIAP